MAEWRGSTTWAKGARTRSAPGRWCFNCCGDLFRWLTVALENGVSTCGRRRRGRSAGCWFVPPGCRAAPLMCQVPPSVTISPILSLHTASTAELAPSMADLRPSSLLSHSGPFSYPSGPQTCSTVPYVTPSTGS